MAAVGSLKNPSPFRRGIQAAPFQLQETSLTIAPITSNSPVAVVTGGARGIGLAIATRLLQSGAAVSLWDMDATALAQAAEQLK